MFMSAGTDRKEAAQLSSRKGDVVEGSSFPVAARSCCPWPLPKASSASAVELGAADGGVDADPASSLGFLIFCSIW